MLYELLETTQKSVLALDPLIATTEDGETKDTLRVVQARGKWICDVIVQTAKVGEVNGGQAPGVGELAANVAKYNGAVSKFVTGAARV